MGLPEMTLLKNRFIGAATCTKLLLLVPLAGLLWAASSNLWAGTLTDPSGGVVASAMVDPDKASSEMNHHIAGLALLAIGVMVICGHRYKRLAFLQNLWPLLFIAAGIFLAIWSDAEIWPRGDLGWSWLLRHDAEARQHKIYAVLLISIGVIEYLRSRMKLNRQWAQWAFPLLAVGGGIFLFFHEHSGATTPAAHEHHQSTSAQSTSLQSSPATAPMAAPAVSSPHNGAHHHHGDAEVEAAPVPQVPDMEAGHGSPQPPHHHVMTGVMLKVRREHIWFAAVGFCIALCKFLYDANFLRGRVGPYLWANSMIALGILLVMYTE
jgi:hypothetical protein